MKVGILLDKTPFPAGLFSKFYFVHAVQGIINGNTKTQTRKNVAIPDGYGWSFLIAGKATITSQVPL